MKQKIIAIVGPTASGKSALAVSLAKKYNGEIISADSRQVYKGLNIGTGKITTREMQGVPHHLLDIVNPKKQFSVTEWRDLSQKKILEIIAREKTPILCGGTGFYIDALLQGVQFPEVLPNNELRKALAKETPAHLYAKLKKLDPRRASSIDRHNPHRLIRAIEIAKTLGKVPSKKKRANPYQVLWIGTDLPQAVLQANIHKRLIDRLKQGMIKEAQALHRSGLSFKRMHELGLEYRWLAIFLQKKIPRKKMIEGLERDIIHYAKRQKTWFKKNTAIQWYRPNTQSDIKKIMKLIDTF